MLKIKKTIILLIPFLLLCGCKKIKDIEVNENNNTYSDIEIFTYCDKKYGIEYLLISGSYQGGITIRLDKNGNPIHCK